MRRFLLLAMLVVSVPAGAFAQAQTAVDARLGPDRVTGPNPEWRVANLFEEGRWKDALESAYSIRLEWQVRAWRKRSFADARGPSVQYSVIIRKQPLLEEYQMIIQSPGRNPSARSFSTLDSLRVAVNTFVTVPFPLRDAGSYYYSVRLDISTLNDEELAKLQRFLDNPTSGEQSGGGAVTRGVMRLFLPTQTLSENTATFVWRPR